MNQCKNCNHSYNGNFCPNCGQKKTVSRFTFKHLTHDFIHGFFHVDKGLFFTIKELFVRPAGMITDFIQGKRVQYFNPFTYLLLVSVVAGFLHQHSGMAEHTVNNFMVSHQAMLFTSKYFSLRLLLTIPIYALIARFIYSNFNYNFTEHLISASYIVNQSVLIGSVGFLILNIWKFSVNDFNIIHYVISFSMNFYGLVVYSQLFKERLAFYRYFKAIMLITTAMFLNYSFVNILVKGLSFITNNQ